MLQANSIAEVITNIDNIIEWSKVQKSRIGYFAVLYRRMTIAVQQGINNNDFEDGARIERLDVNFANRYLQAWDAYTNKQKCTNAWCKVFDACSTNTLIVLQHLFLGINTHINLDLAIASAETYPGEKIYDLKNDFDKINTVIASLMQTVQDSLCKIWSPLKSLVMIAGNRPDTVLNFSISKAREVSWANAKGLAFVQGQAHDNYINMVDSSVAEIAQRIADPGFAISFLLAPVLIMESSDVSDNIDVLKE